MTNIFIGMINYFLIQSTVYYYEKQYCKYDIIYIYKQQLL